MLTRIKSDNTFSRWGLVLVEETKAMTKLVENDVAFIIVGELSVSFNSPQVHGLLVAVSIKFMLGTDFRPVPSGWDKRDTYLGFRDRGKGERDVRVPLPFLDSTLDFGALVGGARKGVVLYSIDLGGEVRKCDPVTRINHWQQTRAGSSD